jgi:3-phenylpropionate/cinnamic acid dioxygenase small subunit
VSAARNSELEAFIYSEAAFLDERRWNDWLDLFVEDCEFWVPSWDDTGEVTTDPNSQISLMYYRDKQGLRERVERITSGLSPASARQPRTCHLITNMRFEPQGDDKVTVRSNWTVHSFRPRHEQMHYGFYEHRLVRQNERWLVQRKKVVVLNDIIAGMIDIYSI